MLSISEPILAAPTLTEETSSESDSTIEGLVNEMRLEIWNHLVYDEDWTSLSRASQVSHRWKLEIEFSWRNFCEKNNILSDEEEWRLKGRNWKWLCKCRKTPLAGKDHGFGWSVGAVPGTLYEGEWKNNQRHGIGRFVWTNNDRYLGEWKEDYKHGHGLMLWTNGDRYDGNWDRDLRHGTAIYVYANGGKYVGQYEKDERHGEGEFFWPDGDYFKGSWKTGGRSGSGFFIKFGQHVKQQQQWTESPAANYSRELPPKSC